MKPRPTCAPWCAAGDERGLRVAIVEILPWNNGYPDAAPAIDDLNRLIASDRA